MVAILDAYNPIHGSISLTPTWRVGAGGGASLTFLVWKNTNWSLVLCITEDFLTFNSINS